jgi:hypothetical protein
VKRWFRPVSAGTLPFTGRNALIGSIDQILLQFRFRFYQIIKRCKPETGTSFCCAAEKNQSPGYGEITFFSMRHLPVRATLVACCGADGTWLAISLPRITGAQSMPGPDCS